MDGQLTDRPLAEIICELTGSRLSGVLRLARERVRAAVYFEGGAVVAALANLRSLRLAEFVRRAGGVEPALLAEVEEKRLPDERAAVALVEAGALTYGELGDILTAQAQEVLREALRWNEGEWQFEPRVRFAGERRARPDAGRLLVERARTTPDEVIARALGEEELLAPTGQEAAAGGEAFARLGLKPEEAFILSRVSGPTTLGKLILVGGMPEAETRRAAYALVLGGLLARPAARGLFTPEAMSQARARPAEQPAAPPAGEAAAPLVKADARTEEPTEAPPPAGGQEPPAADDVRAAMEELLELTRKATHYEVLGVARSAAPGDIKRAYHLLAKRLHPDRFRRDAEGEFIRRLDASFARVTQAYEVLKDAPLRASYDLKLSGQGEQEAATRPARQDAGARAAAAAAVDSPSSPEEKFQRGVAALQKGDDAAARMLLGEAALLVPRQAKYRAYYGLALSRDRGARRQAEAELLAALSLDDRNPTYRVMLAELYQEIGLRRRAEGELRRALALDPGHDAARRLLERLGGAG